MKRVWVLSGLSRSNITNPRRLVEKVQDMPEKERGTVVIFLQVSEIKKGW